MNTKLQQILKATGIRAGEAPSAEQWKLALQKLNQQFEDFELLQGAMEHSYGSGSPKKDYLYLELEKESLNIISKQRDRLEHILEAIPCWVSVINHELEFVSVNQYVSELYGVGRDGFVGKYILWQVGSQELIDFVKNFSISKQTMAQIELRLSFRRSERRFKFSIKKLESEHIYILVGEEVK